MAPNGLSSRTAPFSPAADGDGSMVSSAFRIVRYPCVQMLFVLLASMVALVPLGMPPDYTCFIEGTLVFLVLVCIQRFVHRKDEIKIKKPFVKGNLTQHKRAMEPKPLPEKELRPIIEHKVYLDKPKVETQHVTQDDDPWWQPVEEKKPVSQRFVPIAKEAARQAAEAEAAAKKAAARNAAEAEAAAKEAARKEAEALAVKKSQEEAVAFFTAQRKAAEAEAVQEKPAPPPGLELQMSPLEREIRKLEKKLREVTRLQERAGEGAEMNELQLEKIAYGPGLASELDSLRYRLLAGETTVADVPSPVEEETSGVGTRDTDSLAVADANDEPPMPSQEISTFDVTTPFGRLATPISIFDAVETKLAPLPQSGMLQMSWDRWQKLACKEDACWEWVNYGFCRRSVRCSWSHPPLPMHLFATASPVPASSSLGMSSLVPDTQGEC